MAPAPLFTNITGVTPGFRVLGAPAGVSAQPGLYLSRVALSLGLEPRATGSEIVAALVEARDATPIPPRIVSTGPCKEVVATGADVDLGRLPAPLLHGHDGGRFLNTYGINVARTPDGSWTNWSISRTQFMDARRMSGLVVPTQHLGVIHAMWRERGEDMPVAVAMGSSRRSRSWVGCRCPRTSTRRTSSARISASRSTSCAARRSTFSADWPAEIQERVLERWSEYGYRP